MNNNTKIRLGIGLAGLCAFAGSWYLMSETDPVETEKLGFIQPEFASNALPEPSPVPDFRTFPWHDWEHEEDGEDAFTPRFQSPGQLPQTRTRAS